MEARGFTYNNYQYASYYEANGNIVIERRNLDNPDVWEKSILQGYRITSNDRHNRISMGVSAGDGVIHLAFDHHNSPTMNYARTEKGVGDNPENVTWDNEVFSLAPNLGLEDPIQRVTYPSFHSIGGTGDLILYWRSGSAASGVMNMAHYDSNTQEWFFIGKASSRYGVYDGEMKTRGPYHGGLEPDSKGNIHVQLLWREFPGHIRAEKGIRYGNHGLYYTYSNDGGFTWFNNSGEKVVDLREVDIRAQDNEEAAMKKISIETLDRVVDIPMRMEPSNPSQTSAVDLETDEFHAILRHHKKDTTDFYLHHYIRSTEGEWSVRVIDAFDSNRPEIYFAGDLLYALLYDGSIYVSTRERSFTDWKEINMPVSLSDSLNYYDMTRIGDGVISIFSHNVPAERGDATPIEVRDIQIAQ